MQRCWSRRWAGYALSWAGRCSPGFRSKARFESKARSAASRRARQDEADDLECLTMKNSPLRAAQGEAIEADPRWAKIVGRDKGSDGAFVYSVKTTGVYCRPSCAARLANPANVRFHATPAEAR